MNDVKRMNAGSSRGVPGLNRRFGVSSRSGQVENVLHDDTLFSRLLVLFVANHFFRRDWAIEARQPRPSDLRLGSSPCSPPTRSAFHASVMSGFLLPPRTR